MCGAGALYAAIVACASFFLVRAWRTAEAGRPCAAWRVMPAAEPGRPPGPDELCPRLASVA